MPVTTLSSKVLGLISLFVGAGGAFAATFFPEQFNSFATTFILFTPLALMVALASRGRWLFVGSLMLLGIVVTITVDALLDRSMSRNLFPVEIIIFVATSLPSIALGLALGVLIYMGQKRNSSSR